MSNILVIAAHPDDEILGCGGTMAKHSDNGDDVFVLFLADGESSRMPSSENGKIIEKRYDSARRACEKLGAYEPFFLGMPDNMLDTIPLLDIVKRVEKKITEVQANIIYTHHGGDLNIDHRICHQAVITAARPQPGTTVQAIYSFEVNSSTEWATKSIGEPFSPNYFIDITKYLAKKKRALEEYHYELKDYPHPRSLEGVIALTRVRGIAVGFEYAESFVVERQVKN